MAANSSRKRDSDMTYFELLSTEKDYYNKLTDDERRIYRASQEQLSAISTWNDCSVRAYVDVARLVNELHRLHSRYNDYIELYDADFAKEHKLEDFAEETFSATVQVGLFSAVLPLSCMDECDALYRYLSEVKMNRFEWLCDNFDVAVLIETLESNNCL
jgi:hypothetical protein